MQLHAFIGCLLYVIFVGSVCLRGDYLNTMFVAVSMDGNNQTITITFGLGVENNVHSCTWFLMRLKEALREGREISFITNMNESLVFPYSYHGYTCKSVYMYIYAHELVETYITMEPLFWITSKSYTTSDFEQNFHRLTHDAREVLTNIGNVKWVRSYFLNIRWNIFVERNFIRGRLTNVLTLYVEMVLLRRMQKSIRWQTTNITSDILRVFYFYKNCVVDVNRRTYSCGK
uniref:Uncharacterized protein n=1 Tax=Lactuca sativa TaxID=4236 RepID=A0A9R1UQX3_LACSA|nr:hypothetical protein LSAT_V11C800453110 [Lactuca sativa]